MSDLKRKLNTILSDLDKNIKDKEELEYVKSQIYNISIIFLDEIDKLTELNQEKINVMLEREKSLNDRIEEVEKAVKNIEEEMYISEDCDFSIQCPYCNTEFVEDFTDGFKHEVRCPECDNMIQLEWSQDDECGCEHNCGEKCCDACDAELVEEREDNEDDM